jgi:flagellar basal-body rod protein FlgF/flagellar basal-body rod protein FlgG
MAQDQALELAAHNLANLNTTGYRAQQPVFRSLLAARSMALNPVAAVVNNFGVVEGSRVDLTAGSLEATGNPLDLGIEGSGFFAVRTGRRTLYTRNGSFQVSAKGQLVTASGDAVMGESGAITLPAGAVSVSGDGTISVEGSVVGKIRLAQFAPEVALEAAGDSYYSAPVGAKMLAGAGSVKQGVLESSNVNPMAAVIGLIAMQRQAEMLQRSLSVFYSEFNRVATTDLPKV